MDRVPLEAFAPETDRMPGLVRRYAVDEGSLERRYHTPGSARRRERLEAFHAAWREALRELPAEGLSRDDQADLRLLADLVEASLRELAQERTQRDETAPLIPFAPDLLALDEERRDMLDVDPRAAAGRLDSAERTVRALLAAVTDGRGPEASPVVGYRAAAHVDSLLDTLEAWRGFYHAYHPEFTWWTQVPYGSLTQALRDYAAALRKHVAHADDPDTIVGDPVGREALLADLARALVPYTPEELIAIAARERDWCEAELRRAARDLGLGDDTRAALERAKTLHVPPGDQPALVRGLAREAVDYVTERDLVTVPDLARECWRMEMMPPERQRESPFFLGGECIIVSYPTADMEHGRKLMALRGNNAHFSRATVQHELIPGHYLQMHSQERFRPYRRAFFTPFWTEGWTMHWEMLLWDLGFPRSPEDRVGMLFWRLHRCARVLFSLRFHMGQMTAAECVELLVNEFGHERDNAAAEVRRSFGGDYPPLYQCAYLIGGMQVRALHAEMVGGGQMTHREFHDALMRANCMPIAMVRALLRGLPLDGETLAGWRFAG